MKASKQFTYGVFFGYFIAQAVSISPSLFNISSLSGFDLISEDAYALIEQPMNRLQNIIRGTILPTHWCGIRNSAPFPQAISAVYPHLDSCCRKHDQCPISVNRGKCFQGICNRSFLAPMLHCECEYAFKKCLQTLPKPQTLVKLALSGNERLASDVIGAIYFHVLPKALHGTRAEMKCIRKIRIPKMYRRSENGVSVDSDENWSYWKAYPIVDLESLKKGWFKHTAYLNDITDYAAANEFIKLLSNQLIETDFSEFDQ